MATASILSVRPSDLSYHKVTGEITIGYKSLGFVAPPLTYGESGRRALVAAQAEHRAWLAESNRQHESSHIWRYMNLPMYPGDNYRPDTCPCCGGRPT
jgi:hypothetical protein